MRRTRLAFSHLAAVAVAAVAVAAAVLWLTRRAPVAEAPPGPPAPSRARTRPFVVDVHVHLSARGVGRLAELMERHQFDHVVNLSGGHPLDGLPAQLEAARRSGGRITVFATLAYEQAAAPGYGERMARLLRAAHAQGARGLKIAKLLGLGLRGPDDALIPVDDPELDVVFETAAQLDMPVAIHSGDPKAFWLPVDEDNERRDELRAHPGWSQHGLDVPSFDEVLAQLERRVARHPKTTFISLHFGNAAEEPERVAAQLRKYPNLYVDTAARVPELGRHPPARLRQLFIEFQDRILFGSDLGVGPAGTPLFLGSSGSEPPTAEEERLFFAATRRYFETADRDFAHPTPIQGRWTISGIDLPPDVLRKIYGENAKRVLKLDR
ncbi:MAG: amidohydrolase family protein [Polyangiaceae bacterium]|nr:amidohydrolase family protein [Polyangiaceae bacterium]